MSDTATVPDAEILHETMGRVALIRLNRPGALNALTYPMLAEIRRRVAEAEQDPEVTAIAITGEGRGFCSGANLTAGGGPSSRVTDGGSDGPNQSLIKVFNPFVSMLRRSPKPLLAAVNGVAAGVGTSIAMACDLIVAAESAYFLQAFRRVCSSRSSGHARRRRTPWTARRLPPRSRPRSRTTSASSR